jgi:hypothetical protein
MLLYAFCLFLALVLFVWYSSRVLPRIWRQARADIIKVETDSDNCMMVSVSYLAEATDGQPAAVRTATIQFNESLRTAMFEKETERIQRHYDMQEVYVWYALEVPDECYLQEPSNVSRTFGSLLGLAIAFTLAIGSSYYMLPIALARVTQ